MNSEEKKEINNDSSDEILTIPNILSFFRILLITPFMILFLNGQYIWATVMIIISGLTDCVDGFVARHFNQVSDFGKILDPVADKLNTFSSRYWNLHLDTGGNNCYGYPYNKRFAYANWWYCFNKNAYSTTTSQDGTERLEQFYSIFLYVLL